MITGAQIRAARAMLRWNPTELARRSKLSTETIRRAENADGEAPITIADEHALRAAFGEEWVEFTDAGGPGLRLKSSAAPDEGLKPQELTAENDG
jgi:transcriptional regulator with XRE-family HTH domain